MKMKCLIVEDEAPASRVLQKYIERLPQLELMAVCGDAIEAGEYLQKENIDLLLLDIHLPELSGISWLRTLREPPLVIFTTAYPEYAVESFELEVLDYLVKPIAFERFLKAINKAAAELERKQPHRRLSEERQAFLTVRADRKLYKLNFEDIQYLQAYGDYVKIITRQGGITPKITLQEIEGRLPASQFIRVHRSYIVSLNAIQYMEGNHLRIGAQKIPVGKSNRDDLLKRLEES